MNSLILCFVALLAFVFASDEPTCTWAPTEGPAAGKKYDLSDLVKTGDVTFYEDSSDNYKYFWNFCANAASPCGDGYPAWQQASSPDGTCWYLGSLPKNNNYNWALINTDDINAGVNLTYTGGQLSSDKKNTRSVTLEVKCDQKATQPKINSIQDSLSNKYYYIISMSSIAACPVNAASGGMIFIIILLVVVPVYCIAGAAWNHHKGKHGIELMPNSEFWTSLPGLCKDGVVFCAHGCKSGYAQID